MIVVELTQSLCLACMFDYKSSVSSIPYYKSSVSSIPYYKSSVSSIPYYKSSVSSIPYYKSSVSSIPYYKSSVSSIPYYKEQCQSLRLQVAALQLLVYNLSLAVCSDQELHGDWCGHLPRLVSQGALRGGLHCQHQPDTHQVRAALCGCMHVSCDYT